MKAKIEMISAMLIFGSIGIFVKNINISSIEIAFYRAVVASLFLIFASFFIKQKITYSSIKENALLLIISGMAIGINWILMFQAYKYTTISNATLIYNTAPIFVILLSPIVLKERITCLKIGCITTTMVGLFLIVYAGNSNINTSYSHIKGILYGFLAAILYASIILINKFIKNLPSFEVSLIQLTVSAIVLLISILYENNLNIVGISHKDWVFILILGIIHTGVAYILYFDSIKELTGQSIAFLSYIAPVSAVIFASIFLEENMTLHQIIGGILILGSTFISEFLRK